MFSRLSHVLTLAWEDVEQILIDWTGEEGLEEGMDLLKLELGQLHEGTRAVAEVAIQAGFEAGTSDAMEQFQAYLQRREENSRREAERKQQMAQKAREREDQLQREGAFRERHQKEQLRMQAEVTRLRQELGTLRREMQQTVAAAESPAGPPAEEAKLRQLEGELQKAQAALETERRRAREQELELEKTRQELERWELEKTSPPLQTAEVTQSPPAEASAPPPESSDAPLGLRGGDEGRAALLSDIGTGRRHLQKTTPVEGKEAKETMDPLMGILSSALADRRSAFQGQRNAFPKPMVEDSDDEDWE